MRRSFLALVSILILTFAAIAILKNWSRQASTEEGDVAMAVGEKERIQQFWTLYRKATDYRIAGNIEEANEHYQAALELNDNHEDTWYYLAASYRALRKLDKAEDAWKRLSEINPGSARAHLQLGGLYVDFPKEALFFNPENARKHFQRALEINQEETGPLLRLGHVALLKGNLSDAKQYFDAVTASNFRSVEAYFLNGYLAWKSGDSETALLLMEDAVTHSRPMKPVEGVLGEGDTKTGSILGQSGRAKRKSLFEDYLEDLSELGEPDRREMEARFRQLDVFLTRLRHNIPS